MDVQIPLLVIDRKCFDHVQALPNLRGHTLKVYRLTEFMESGQGQRESSGMVPEVSTLILMTLEVSQMVSEGPEMVLDGSRKFPEYSGNSRRFQIIRKPS